MSTFDPRDLPLVPHAASRCLPPVHVDADGRAVPDPYEVLGLTERPASAEQIREAAHRLLLDHPPEQYPREAQRILEARNRLLSPAAFEARHLGVLHVPDPDAWGCPRPGQQGDAEPLTPLARTLGQAVLYTLVEEALWTEGLGALYERTIAALTHDGQP
jgi:curved DNA-binding protein CbpA